MKKIPSWQFDESCEMIEFDGNNDISHIVCPRCNTESLCLKNFPQFK